MSAIQQIPRGGATRTLYRHTRRVYLVDNVMISDKKVNKCTFGEYMLTPCIHTRMQYICMYEHVRVYNPYGEHQY